MEGRRREARVLHMTKRAGATLATFVGVALLWSPVGAQHVDNPSNWVTVLNDALEIASGDCVTTLNQAIEGVQFAIDSFNPADSTGGLVWCEGWGCGPRYGAAAWTDPTRAPISVQIRFNKKFHQDPAHTALKESIDHPDATLGVVLGHEGVHAYRLKHQIEQASSHLAFSGKVNPCFVDVENPTLLGSRRTASPLRLPD